MSLPILLRGLAVANLADLSVLSNLSASNILKIMACVISRCSYK